MWAAFPDARLHATGPRLTNGTHASAPAKLMGTHREPLEGLVATNRSVVVHVVFFAELRDDRLFRIRAFFDAYGAAVRPRGRLTPARVTSATERAEPPRKRSFAR